MRKRARTNRCKLCKGRGIILPEGYMNDPKPQPCEPCPRCSSNGVDRPAVVDRKSQGAGEKDDSPNN
jgi:hypothetical protein